MCTLLLGVVKIQLLRTHMLETEVDNDTLLQPMGFTASRHVCAGFTAALLVWTSLW